MPGHEPDVGPPTSAPLLRATDASDPVRSRAEVDFRQLFDDTYRPLVAYARRRTNDWTEADDIVGEVYAVAWRRRDELVATDNPLPWMYGVAANVLRNHRRSSDRRLRLVNRIEAEPTLQTGGDPAERTDADLRHALTGLSFDDQEVLKLIAWDGLSHAEAADALGCTANAVGIRIHRARQRLQTALDQNRETT